MRWIILKTIVTCEIALTWEAFLDRPQVLCFKYNDRQSSGQRHEHE